MTFFGELEAILTSRATDLKYLAQLTEGDWATLYRGHSLQGCDLRGQDLSGLDLQDTDIDKANIDQKTIIDPEFDPRLPKSNESHRTFVISKELALAVEAFAVSAQYEYSAWAYKFLFSRFRQIAKFGDLQKYERAIEDNAELTQLAKLGKIPGGTRKRILISTGQLEEIGKFEQKHFGVYSGYRFALLAALMAQRADRLRFKHDGNLKLEVFWPELMSQKV